jgi:hypothetical protein
VENQKNVKNLNDIYEKYQKTLDEDKFKLKGLLKKFENYGGLTDKDKFAMRSSLEMLESSRKQNLATIKEFLEDDIVFYLNKDRIFNIQKAIKQERPLTLLTYVDEIEQFLGEKSVSSIKSELNKMISSDVVEIKYNATPKLNKLIEDVVSKFSALTTEELQMILKNSREDLNNTKVYKKIIGNNENANANDLQQLLKEIKTLEMHF